MEKKKRKSQSQIGYYLKNAFRYWRKSLRMIFFYNKLEWSEITVDELLAAINSDQFLLVLDIRTVREYESGHIPNARSISVTDIKSNIDDLLHHKEKLIVTVCPGGGLSLVAVDILVDAGFKDVRSLKDGLDKWTAKGYPITKDDEFYYPSKKDKSKIGKEEQSLDEKFTGEVHHTVDARGLTCPHPIMKSMKALRVLEINQVLEIFTTDPGSVADIPAWARSTGQELLFFEECNPKNFCFYVKKLK